MQALQAQALELGRVTVFSAGDAAGAMLELSKAGLTVSADHPPPSPACSTWRPQAGLTWPTPPPSPPMPSTPSGWKRPRRRQWPTPLPPPPMHRAPTWARWQKALPMPARSSPPTGRSVNDLAAALSIMSNNGIAGAEAGTGLKVMMQRLAAPTAGARKAMNELGLSIYDSTGADASLRRHRGADGERAGGAHGRAAQRRDAGHLRHARHDSRQHPRG